MLIKDMLQKLDLGNSVAEFDSALDTYFVETHIFHAVIADKKDIVAGDKGTGKTALFRILQARASTRPELANVTILPAFNPSGSPIFQQLTETDPLDEGSYGSVWKTYVLALVGNWALNRVGKKEWSADLKIIDALLSQAELRSLDHTPVTVFARIADWAKKKLNSMKSVQVSVGIPNGPSITPKLEFDSQAGGGKTIRYEEALAILDRAIGALGIRCWVVLDRLDEAFQSAPAVEVSALRALFRVFLDLTPFTTIRLKLFVRRDLFSKVTQTSFVNLTHVNARKIEITWDEEDLKHLLCQRVRENSAFLSDIGLTKESTNDDIFGLMFPPQVDPGGGKPPTWGWMMSRIRDGNGAKPPRNLIDLVKKAQEEQTRREERESNLYDASGPVIGPDALKRGLNKLSTERVNDTLLAEAGDRAALIEKFRDGKAEHNGLTLATTLGVPHDQIGPHIRALIEIGVLEQVGESYKIPMLYRAGLNVTNGKAF